MGDNKYANTLKSGILAKNVSLSTASEGRFSNSYFDMLPGKSYSISFSGYLSADVEIKTLIDSF